MTQITEHLYLGARGDPGDYDVRVNLTTAPGTDTTHRFPLSNTACDQETFDTAVETVIEQLGEGKDVLVHCEQGRSRSAAVVACVLAYQEEISLREAFNRLDADRGIAVSDAMRRCAVRYRAAHLE